MRAVGVPFDKTVIANLETGRRRFVTVAELLALALVLDVAPLHLMVPTDDTPTDDTPAPEHEVYPVTPTLTCATSSVRAWIRGESPLGQQDPRTYFAEVPAEEWHPREGAWGSEAVATVSDFVRKRRRDGTDRTPRKPDET